MSVRVLHHRTSNNFLLDSALQAFKQGNTQETVLLMEKYCVFCMSRNKDCNKCGIQRAVDKLTSCF